MSFERFLHGRKILPGSHKFTDELSGEERMKVRLSSPPGKSPETIEMNLAAFLAQRIQVERVKKTAAAAV